MASPLDNEENLDEEDIGQTGNRDNLVCTLGYLLHHDLHNCSSEKDPSISIDKSINEITVQDQDGDEVSWILDDVYEASESKAKESQEGVWEKFRNYFDKRVHIPNQFMNVVVFGGMGSGKAFLLHGDQAWESRGIIPRFIEYFFDNSNAHHADYMQMSMTIIRDEEIIDVLDCGTAHSYQGNIGTTEATSTCLFPSRAIAMHSMQHALVTLSLACKACSHILTSISRPYSPIHVLTQFILYSNTRDEVFSVRFFDIGQVEVLSATKPASNDRMTSLCRAHRSMISMKNVLETMKKSFKRRKRKNNSNNNTKADGRAIAEEQVLRDAIIRECSNSILSYLLQDAFYFNPDCFVIACLRNDFDSFDDNKYYLDFLNELDVVSEIATQQLSSQSSRKFRMSLGDLHDSMRIELSDTYEMYEKCLEKETEKIVETSYQVLNAKALQRIKANQMKKSNDNDDSMSVNTGVVSENSATRKGKSSNENEIEEGEVAEVIIEKETIRREYEKLKFQMDKIRKTQLLHPNKVDRHSLPIAFHLPVKHSIYFGRKILYLFRQILFLHFVKNTRGNERRQKLDELFNRKHYISGKTATQLYDSLSFGGKAFRNACNIEMQELNDVINDYLVDVDYGTKEHEQSIAQNLTKCQYISLIEQFQQLSKERGGFPVKLPDFRELSTEALESSVEQSQFPIEQVWNNSIRSMSEKMEHETPYLVLLSVHELSEVHTCVSIHRGFTVIKSHHSQIVKRNRPTIPESATIKALKGFLLEQLERNAQNAANNKSSLTGNRKRSEDSLSSFHRENDIIFNLNELMDEDIFQSCKVWLFSEMHSVQDRTSREKWVQHMEIDSNRFSDNDALIPASECRKRFGKISRSDDGYFEIYLNGMGLEQIHCVFEQRFNRLTVRPLPLKGRDMRYSEVAVNGKSIKHETELKQDDVVKLGTNLFLLVQIPRRETDEDEMDEEPEETRPATAASESGQTPQVSQKSKSTASVLLEDDYDSAQFDQWLQQKIRCNLTDYEYAVTRNYTESFKERLKHQEIIRKMLLHFNVNRHEVAVLPKRELTSLMRLTTYEPKRQFLDFLVSKFTALQLYQICEAYNAVSVSNYLSKILLRNVKFEVNVLLLSNMRSITDPMYQRTIFVDLMSRDNNLNADERQVIVDHHSVASENQSVTSAISASRHSQQRNSNASDAEHHLQQIQLMQQQHIQRQQQHQQQHETEVTIKDDPSATVSREADYHPSCDFDMNVEGQNRNYAPLIVGTLDEQIGDRAGGHFTWNLSSFVERFHLFHEVRDCLQANWCDGDVGIIDHIYDQRQQIFDAKADSKNHDSKAIEMTLNCDPFLDTLDDELVGVCFLYCDSLQYLLDINDMFPIVNFKGEECGKLKLKVRAWIDNVEIAPDYLTADRDCHLRQFLNKTCIIRFYFQNLVNMPGKLCNAPIIQFQFYHHTHRYFTNRYCGVNSNAYLNSVVQIEQKITNDFINYIMTSSIEFEVYAKRNNANNVRSGAPSDANDNSSDLLGMNVNDIIIKNNQFDFKKFNIFPNEFYRVKSEFFQSMVAHKATHDLYHNRFFPFLQVNISEISMEMLESVYALFVEKGDNHDVDELGLAVDHNLETAIQSLQTNEEALQAQIDELEEDLGELQKEANRDRKLAEALTIERNALNDRCGELMLQLNRETSKMRKELDEAKAALDNTKRQNNEFLDRIKKNLTRSKSMFSKPKTYAEIDNETFIRQLEEKFKSNQESCSLS